MLDIIIIVGISIFIIKFLYNVGILRKIAEIIKGIKLKIDNVHSNFNDLMRMENRKSSKRSFFKKVYKHKNQEIT